MLPYAEVVLRKIAELARQIGGPVRTVVLAGLLGISDRTARWYAHQLEQAGLVGRQSPKTGWLPARRTPTVQMVLPGFERLCRAA